ncbi:transmembrane protein, putative (macronuclear) [Tetrahymena thermophila SB210]|uniref:Transmembrane protein, putative n=1 Tax=Tetrahymena thermophila (strain SB210) TaxID=312017 RepID=Q232X2_TETTS|nr:transmembrane protein, putative [Tetrahymena thermophila SB210]EAR91708.3 transmembrane protein, putative [Tetrahymena thermophila SB210]|eukprot:XP_001011953.3 transmembrane protein, putative [Tetrahymena thermophila SB210]
MNMEDKERKDFHEVELEGNYASNESADDHINVNEHQNQNDRQPIIPRQSERLIGQKRVAVFALVMIIFCTLFVAAIYYTFFKMGDPKIFIYKNDIFLTKCPKFTFQIGNICHDECPERMYQRGEECVSHCGSSDFVFDNFCIISNCLIEEEEDKLVKGYFDFSSKLCVKECSSQAFKFLDRYCFDFECPKEEIYQIVKQYNLKRDDQEFEQEYDLLLKTQKDFTLQDFAITSNITGEKTCLLGCTDQFNKYINFNMYSFRYECLTKCPYDKFFIKKHGQNICLDSCPEKTFISATSNECVESCGQYAVENNNCILTCQDGLLKLGKECVTECSSYFPYINSKKECVKTCQNEPLFQYVDKGVCSSSCPKYIQKQKNELVCIDKSCDLLGSDQKMCVDKCNENDMKIVLNNELQCFEIKSCENKMEFFVPGMGCQSSCPYQYPIQMNGMCLQKCFDNWSLHENNCIESCPQLYPYTQDGQCVTQCDDNNFTFGYFCFQKCPSDYFQDIATKTCTQTCEGFYIESSRDCFAQCPQEAPYSYQKKCLSMCPLQTFVYVNEKNIYQCVNVCPPETYQTPDSKCVKQCPQNLYTLKETKQCVQKCPIISDENRVCKNNCTSKQRYIQGEDQCYEECPSRYYKMEATNECVLSCLFLTYKPAQGENQCVQQCSNIQKFQLHMTCVDKCPMFFLNNLCYDYCPLSNPYYQDNECVKQCSLGRIQQDNQCLTQCPDGLFYVEGLKKCQKSCPQDFYIDVENKSCKQTCEGFTIENKCVKQCPFYSTQMGKQCWLNSPQYPGPYLLKDGTILQECNFEKGYYSNQRMCNKCNGGDQCKKCSQFYGICLECEQQFSLYNNSCYKSCPDGYISQQGVCIKDDKFLKNNLFFREYNNSNYFGAGQKIKYSILQDVQFINDYDIDFNNQNNNNNYTHTVIVHLHDLNSTYLDFYSYPFSQNNSDSFIENLKLQVIDQGISIITVQSPDILYFSNFFDFVLSELLPSLSYFKANVVFSGVGLASNSIVQHVSNILNNQQGEMYRRILGNYMIDMQEGFEGDSFVKDFTQNQYQEFQQLLASDEDVYKQVPQICKIFTPYIRLNDIVTIKRNQKSAENLTNVISIIGIRNSCQNINIKPQNSLKDFQREKNQQQYNRVILSEQEYGSEQRKSAIYKHISENLLQEVSSWINSESMQTSNLKLNQLL